MSDMMKRHVTIADTRAPSDEEEAAWMSGDGTMCVWNKQDEIVGRLTFAQLQEIMLPGVVFGFGAYASSRETDNISKDLLL